MRWLTENRKLFLSYPDLKGSTIIIFKKCHLESHLSSVFETVKVLPHVSPGTILENSRCLSFVYHCVYHLCIGNKFRGQEGWVEE